jgi:hypothetical protein
MSQATLRELLVEYGKVMDLVQSIAADGILPAENIIVVKEDRHDVVVEGNRRVCACQLILDPSTRPPGYKKGFPTVAEDALATISKLKAIRAPDRAAAERLITKKHTMPGILQWGPMAKQRRIWRLIETGTSIPDVAEQFGMKKGDVLETLRERNILERAKHLKCWTKSEREQLQDPNLSVNPLTRFFELKGVKSTLRLRFDTQGEIVTALEASLLDDAFERLTRELLLGGKGSLKTRGTAATIFPKVFAGHPKLMALLDPAHTPPPAGEGQPNPNPNEGNGTSPPPPGEAPPGEPAPGAPAPTDPAAGSPPPGESPGEPGNRPGGAGEPGESPGEPPFGNRPGDPPPGNSPGGPPPGNSPGDPPPGNSPGDPPPGNSPGDPPPGNPPLSGPPTNTSKGGKPKPKPDVFFESLQCTVPDQGLLRVTKEIASISSSLKTYPTAATFLLRALLERALWYCIEQKRLLPDLRNFVKQKPPSQNLPPPPPGSPPPPEQPQQPAQIKDPGLEAIIRYCLKNHTKIFADNRVQGVLSYLMNEKIFMDMVIHGRWMHADEVTLKTIANRSRPVFQMILDGSAIAP